MRYLHTMVRVSDLDASLDFYVDKLGLKEFVATRTSRAATRWSSWRPTRTRIAHRADP